MADTEQLYLGRKEYQVLGTRPVRHDGADKVTGKAIYTADMQLPNMAHGKIVRSYDLKDRGRHGSGLWRRWCGGDEWWDGCGLRRAFGYLGVD